jgi:serine/threonine protein kinase
VLSAPCRPPPHSQEFHKVFNPRLFELSESDQFYVEAVAEISTEATMLARLQSEYILRFLALGVNDMGRPTYLVTELANCSLGGYLNALKARGEKLSLALCMKLCSDVLAGIMYLHFEFNVPVVHRDLKPENVLIFIGADGGVSAKLGDVGFARFLSYTVDGTFTQMKGSGFYMAPESVTATYDEKVDMFSFGVMVAEVVWGFVAGEPVTYDPSVRGSLVASASQYIKQQCPELAWVMRACMHEDPGDRPSAAEALCVLHDTLDRYNCQPSLSAQLVRFQCAVTFAVGGEVCVSSVFLTRTQGSPQLCPVAVLTSNCPVYCG